MKGGRAAPGTGHARACNGAARDVSAGSGGNLKQKGAAAPTAPALDRVKFNLLDAFVDLRERRLEQRVLAPEIMIDHPLVHARQTDDLIHGDGVKAVPGEKPDRRLEDATTRAIGVARNCPG